MQRRDFLKVAALSGAAIAVPSIDALAGTRKDDKTEPVLNDKPVREFKFRPDGKFKILQLTDTHYVAGDKRSERAEPMPADKNAYCGGNSHADRSTAQSPRFTLPTAVIEGTLTNLVKTNTTAAKVAERTVLRVMLFIL